MAHKEWVSVCKKGGICTREGWKLGVGVQKGLFCTREGWKPGVGVRKGRDLHTGRRKRDY